MNARNTEGPAGIVVQDFTNAEDAVRAAMEWAFLKTVLPAQSESATPVNQRKGERGR